MEKNTDIGMSERLARIDERTLLLLNKIEKVENTLQTYYVTQQEFAPIKSIVYGMVGVILLAVVGGLVALLIK